MKPLLFLISALLFSSCISENKETYFQSYGNIYDVELINFEKEDSVQLVERMHNKTFNIKTEEIVWPAHGHTFMINSTKKERKYYIKIKNNKSNKNGFDLNIQGFVREGKNLRRVRNPGNFAVAASDVTSNDKYHALKILLINLSYK